MSDLKEESMGPPGNRFIISCPARSGSTMLVHLLRSNPQVLCHGEVFGLEGRIGALAGSYALQRKGGDSQLEEALWNHSQGNPEEFLNDVVFNAQERRSVGFKFKTDEAFNPTYQSIFDLIRRDPEVKVIHLRRRDLLAQYVSLRVVHTQTGVTLLREGEKPPEIRPLKIDLADLLSFFADVLHREKLAMEAYAEHPQIMVDYEDLIDPENPVRDQLQEFLGVIPVVLATPTRKIISDNYGLVEDMDQLFLTLAQRGLAKRAAT